MINFEGSLGSNQFVITLPNIWSIEEVLALIMEHESRDGYKVKIIVNEDLSINLNSKISRPIKFIYDMSCIVGYENIKLEGCVVLWEKECL